MAHDFTVKALHDRLSQIEASGVKILHACDVGSHAKGIQSPGSDLDCRFIFLRPDGFSRQKQTLTYPLDDGIDLLGWELESLLRMAARGGVMPAEWMSSHRFYRLDTLFQKRLAALIDDLVDPMVVARHHRLHLRQAIRDLERSGPTYKSVFAAVHPALSYLWMASRKFIAMPPMCVWDLASGAGIPSYVRNCIEELAFEKGFRPSSTPIRMPRRIRTLLACATAARFVCRQTANRSPDPALTAPKIERFVAFQRQRHFAAVDNAQLSAPSRRTPDNAWRPDLPWPQAMNHIDRHL